MGYFGLATRENKIAWTIIAVCVLLGAAFWIPGVLQYKRCLNRYATCICKGGKGTTASCLDPNTEPGRQAIRECIMQRGQCRKTPIIIWSLGFLFLVGFSWVPCFYFCCCSKDPKLAGSNATQPQSAVQMATGQPYGPAAHYTAHPFATQPYGPMPYYTGTAAQQQQQQQPNCPPGYSVGYPVGQPQQQPQQQQGGAGQVPVNNY